MKYVHNLKHTVRRGWEYCNVSNPERIASHMYAMSMMTFLISKDDNLDRLKCTQLALVHDLAESIVGDITPADNISKEEKHRREDEAMKTLSALVGDEVGSLLYNLWIEYEENSTSEAKFVKDLDRFDLLFTSVHYEKRDGEGKKCQLFFDTHDGKFQHPFVKKLVEELLKERDQY